MKFNEKLMELRKKQGLSQEELGYKLNVTRQTISKWELGQTTPEMEKLTEMCKIFNVSVDELINESEITSNVNPIIEDQPIGNKNSREKNILIIIIIVLIVVMISIGIKMFSTFSAFNMFDKNFKLLNRELDKHLEEEGNKISEAENFIQDMNNKLNVNIFNGTLELYKGSNIGTQLKSLLDEVITINKKEDKKVTVKYMETETQDTEEIQKLKENIKNSNNFEVIFDYDEEGYIYKLTIQKSVSEIEVKSFNSFFEMYAGSCNGMIVTHVLDDVITSNKTQDRKITVKYQTTETQNSDEIKNIKKNFKTFDNCEIIYEYDTDGFINKVIIEKL